MNKTENLLKNISDLARRYLGDELKLDVMPGALKEAGALFEQEVCLTFIDESKGDDSSRGPVLLDLARGIYKHLAALKCGDRSVRQVRGFSAAEPIYSREKKHVAVACKFIVQYREA